MFEYIKKRNSEIVKFDIDKIINAIAKAGGVTKEFDYGVAKSLAIKVCSISEIAIKSNIPTVEEIQDIVEEVLISSTYKKTAKVYILYRDQHRTNREVLANSGVDLIDSYLNKLDWQVNENSNMSYSLQGLNNYLASEISKLYWLNKIYPPNIRKEHMDGSIHIHDLNQLSVYCVGWDLNDLLIDGFTGVYGKVASKPAKHFRSILGQVVNFFYTLQGEASGAQAFANFDTLLAPFIYYDNLTYKEVKQAIQEFIFNVNVPTRVGFQTPFTNITMDLICSELYAEKPAIIGGKYMDRPYKDFQEEIYMINRAFLEVMSEGDANGRVFTFPIPTYNITKDFDWDNPVLELLWEVTAKYGIPYFANFVNSDMDPKDIRSMCCRLRIDVTKLATRGGGLFGANPLTGSIGVVTINMPRIAYLSKTKNEFFNRLSVLMEIAKDSLEIKRKVLEKYTEMGLYPYVKFYLREIKRKTGSYWANHFSTIGLIGMNEACLNLFGKDIGTEEGKAFANNTMDFMRKILLEYQEKTKHDYNLEATPAEGTSYRLAKLDKQQYPQIITAKEHIGSIDTKEYYTNSTQLPVNYTSDLFEVLDVQDEIQTKYTGGTVIHLFGGERVSNSSIIKKLVKKICENYKLPYFSITPTFSICKNHGYLNGEHVVCPTCKEECEIYSRIVGYLRPVKQWNEGKKSEYKLRKCVKYEL